MTSKRVPLALVLSAVLFVTAGFATTKKIQHNNRSIDWNDLSLQNGDLPDSGSSMSNGVGNLTLSQGGGPGGILTLPPGTPDNWNGGTGTWSDAGNWNNGVPGAGSDVTIYSGGADNVTLDVGSTTINSLTLGGASGPTSELTDGGVKQTLTIAQGLTVGSTGYLFLIGGTTVTAGTDSSNAGMIYLSNGSSLSVNGNLENSSSFGIVTNGGGSAVNVTGTLTNDLGAQLTLFSGGDKANVGNLVNNGSIYIFYAATLNLTNQPGGVTDVPAGANWNIYGSFTEGGSNFGFENLASLEGAIALENGQSQTIVATLTISGGGMLDVGNGTTLTINGDVDNSGIVTTNNSGLAGGNQINISGMLTNQPSGQFNLLGPGDMATLGSLDNTGLVSVLNGSTLQVNGGVTNSGIGQFIVDGGSTATMSSLDTSFLVDVKSGSTLQVNGDATNSGNIFTGLNGTGGNQVNITGVLTNQMSGQLVLLGPGDLVTLGSLDNSGLVNVESAGSTLQVNGDVTNSGVIYTSVNGSGGNTINIAGMLTNSGTFELAGPGDMGTIGNGVSNSGTVDVENGSTLQVNGDVTNSGILATNYNGSGGGNTLNITGNLNNQGGGDFFLLGAGDIATLGGLTNSGFVNLENGSTLQINGDVSNFSNLYTSYYGSGGNTLNITGTLTNNSGAQFAIGGIGDMASVGSIVNNGGVFIYYGATLNLTNQMGGVTDVPGDSSWEIFGNFTEGGTNFGFENLASIEGYVDLQNQQSSTITPGGGTLTLSSTGALEVGNGTALTIMGGVNNSGSVDLEGSSTLQINGDANNSGFLGASLYGGGGGNTLNITGNLNNQAGGQFILNGPADLATIGSLTNNAGGFVDVESGSTLTISGDVTNFAGGGGQQGIFTSYNGSGGNTLNIGGMLTNNGDFELAGAGDMANISGNVANNGNFYINGTGSMASMGGLNNAGFMLVENGSTLQVNGDATNSGTLYTGYFLGGGNTLSITGTLTNQAGGQFALLGPGDTGTIGNGLTNNVGGLVDVEGGSTLKITGDVDNFGELITNDFSIGGSNILTITGGLTNEASGEFILYGAGDTASIGNGLTNSGVINVDGGSTLNITGDVNNSGSMLTNQGGNTISISGMLINSGTFQLNGPGDMASIGNGLSNFGTVDVENGSTLQINGDASNFGTLATSFNGGSGGNTLNISGNLDNHGVFWMVASGDVANVGTLNNGGGGYVRVNPGATLNLTAQPDGITDAAESTTFQLWGTFNAGGDNGFANLNSAEGAVQLYGQNFTITPGSGTLTISADGSLTANYNFASGLGTTLTIAGSVDNSGFFGTSYNYAGPGDTLTINGDLTNRAGGEFILYGPSDVVTIAGTLTNNGSVIVAAGTTLNVNNLPDGLTDVVANSSFDLAGTFNVGANNGFYKLTSVEGGLILENGQTIGDTPNGGTLTIGGTGVVHVLNGTTFDINGNLQVDPGGVFSINDPNPTTVNVSGTILNLGGTINVLGPLAVLNAGNLGNGGLLTLPAGSTINLAHSFYQLANGTLGESITPTGFGVINVNGSALLDGTLAILLQGGYNPAVGSTYKFLNFTSGELAGTFANILNDVFNGGTEKWMVDYENGGGFVELIAEPNGSPVPEPATLLVLIPGLLGVGYGLRRRLLQ